MLETHVIVVMWWIWPIVKQLCRHQKKLRQLSQPADLETLFRVLWCHTWQWRGVSAGSSRLWLQGIQLRPERNWIPIRLCFINVYTYPLQEWKNSNYCCTVWQKLRCIDVCMPSSTIRIPSSLNRSSRTNFLTGMHCFKSAADQSSWRCMASY